MKKNSLILCLSLSLSLTAMAAEVTLPCETGAVLTQEAQSTARVVAPQCFDTRPSFTEFVQLNQSEMLNVDQKVCTCLQGNPFTKAIMESAKPIPNDFLEIEKVSSLNHAVEHINDHVEVARNKFLFQAISLNGGAQDEDFLKNYSMNYLNDSSEGLVTQSNERIASMRSRKPGPMITVSKELDPKYYLDHTSCFEIRDFIAYGQVPKKNEVYEAFGKAESFIPEEWNYTQMEKSEQDVYLIDAKRQFLDANPMYKVLFSSTNPEVRKQQEALFKALKKNFSETYKKCGSPSSQESCQLTYLKAGMHAQDLAEIKEIFRTPEVIKQLNEATEKQLSEDINDELRPLLDQTRPSIINLVAAAGVEGCDGSLSKNSSRSQDYTQCVSAFKTHCQKLSDAEKLPLLQDDTHYDDESAINIYLLDPLKNERFSTLQKGICRARSDGKVPATVVDFEKFRKDLCANPTEKLCEPTNRKKLLARFLTDFPNSPGEVGTSKYAKSYEALISFLEQSKEVDLDERTFKNIAQTGTTKEEFTRSLTEYKRTYVASPEFRTAQAAPEVQASNPVIKPRDRVTRTENADLSPTAIAPATFAYPQSSAQFSNQQPTARPTQSQTRHSPEQATKFKTKPDTYSSSASIQEPKPSENLKRLENEISQLRDKLKESTASTQNQARPNEIGSRSPTSAMPMASQVQGAPSHTSQQQMNSVVQAQTTNPSASNQRSFPMSFTSFASSEAPTPSAKSPRGLYNVKYDLDKESKSGSIIVAQELLLSKVDPQVISEANKNQTIPVSVTKEDFEKIANRDLETLSVLARRLQSISGDVLKVNVTSLLAGVEPLQLLFLKKEGQMLYQPIRTHTFQRLREITTQQ